jgi:hypothetical protein
MHRVGSVSIPVAELHSAPSAQIASPGKELEGIKGNIYISFYNYD